jgi:4-amino-4-deoxy-L-arabinose transferase-like glycosyltransferase
VLWNRAVGFEQGDPLEYVNIAYKLAFGIGIEWWDLRPLLLPILYVPVLYLAQLWPDPSGEAMVRALRLVSVLLGTGTVWLTYLLGRRLSGEAVGLGAGLLVAVNPVVNRLSVSTYAEVPSTFFVLVCLWLLLRATANTPPLPSPAHGAGAGGGGLLAAGAGLALGLGCMIRYQAIFFLPPIGLWVAFVALARARGGPLARVRASLSPRRPSGGLLLGFCGGLLLAILLQGIIELLAYGRPFHSLLVSFDYNVTSGQAPVEFGQEPFGWFVATADDWLGIVAAVLLLLGLPSLVRGPSLAGWRLVGLTGLTMLLALSALPHKEDRFMAQVLPVLALLAAQGAMLVSRIAGYPFQRATAGIRLLSHVLILLLAAAPMLLASWRLDLESNVGYVAGVKQAAQLKPGGTLGTIPWLVARPYAGTTLTLTRMDRNVWERRDEVAQTIGQADYLLFPEYWLLEDRTIDKMVSASFHSIESYEDGVVLYQNRRLDEPSRRRGR